MQQHGEMVRNVSEVANLNEVISFIASCYHGNGVAFRP